jgi:signal transduction histidine kinase
MSDIKQEIIGSRKATSDSIEICPISGLRILRKPEWTDVDFGGTYRANISLLGERIIVNRPSGFITLSGVIQSMALIDRIVSGEMGKNASYVKIEDLANFKGNSLEARRFYISYMKKQTAFSALIFCNASTFSKISFKLAKRLNIVPFAVDMVGSYSEGVRLALDNLKKNLPQTEAFRNGDPMPPGRVYPENEETGGISKTNHWRFDEMGYSLDLEMIHGNILHSISKGFMKEVHIPMIAQIRQTAFEAIQPDGRIDFFIASVGEFSGVNPKARILYMNSLKRWHEQHPFKMFILYGSNRFVRTATNLARPFMPFKVRTAKDLNSALKMVGLEEGGAAGNETGWGDGSADFESLTDLTKEQYVDELLGYIAKIRWDSEGPEFSEHPSASHPLSAVFDAVLLIKSELDQVFKEREAANEALKQARDGLEKRVEERTKDLSVLNRKLQEEIVKRKKTLAELEKSNRELKETQNQLIQSAKLVSIGELASGVAHELNQPLMVIRTTVQLTRRRLNKGGVPLSEADSQLELVEKNTKRMMNIIEHLRLFSRQSTRDFERVDVNRVIEESLLMIGEQLRLRGIGVKRKLISDLPMVSGNSNHLEQVILNLLTNARDAIEEARSEGYPKREMTIEINTDLSVAQPGFVEILIRDSGKGISSHVDRKIFDPFFTTKEVGKGTGLGLSISYGIIKDHSGEIEVAETGPSGTTFRIRLPVWDKTENAGETGV